MVFDVIKIVSVFLSITSLIAGVIYLIFYNDHVVGKNVETLREAICWSFVYALEVEMLILGFVGLIHGCCHICCGENEPTRSGHRHHSNCGDSCIYMHYGGCGGGNCGGGDCGGGNGNNKDGLVAILMVIAVILIIIGTVYAVIVSILLISKMSATHYAKMQAKLMAREYVVKNLEKYNRDEILKLAAEVQHMQPIEPSAPEPDFRKIVETDVSAPDGITIM